jgi:DNA-directed RNA polymerase specialized sigma subunit
MEIKEEIAELRKEIDDLKSLFIIFLQKIEVDNQKIADAVGISPGRVSQIVNKNKYPRK